MRPKTTIVNSNVQVWPGYICHLLAPMCSVRGSGRHGRGRFVVPQFRRAVATLIAALTVLATTAPFATAVTLPEHRSQQRDGYVALGDSYAAGLGAGTPKDACGRSSYGY